MDHYLTFSTIFLLAFFTSVTFGSEEKVSSPSRVVYYSPIDVEQQQQPGRAYLAETRTRTARGVESDLFGTLPDDPIGSPSPDVKRQLKEILETSRKESSASGNASAETPGPAPPFSDPQNPPPSLPVASHEGNAVIAKEYLTGENGIVAILKDGSTIPVTQTTDGYYDQFNRKVVLEEGGQGLASPQDGVTQINQILLIVLAFGSTFAAIFIGFIAWDNQRRLEEAITSQNRRFTGGGSDAFSDDPHSMEPETFSFSTDSLSGNAFDGFDSGTSFRTIA